MSSVIFFPSKWNIDHSWTRVSCIGKNTLNNPVHVTIKNVPYLIMVYATDKSRVGWEPAATDKSRVICIPSDELESFRMQGVILSYETLTSETFRLFFSDHNAISLFNNHYIGAGRIINHDPMRNFFGIKSINPYSWLEIKNIRTAPFPSEFDLDYLSDSIQSAIDQSQPCPLLNLFVYVDIGEEGCQINATAKLQSQVRTHEISSFTQLGEIVTAYKPDQLIYSIKYQFEDQIERIPIRGAYINWFDLPLQSPKDLSELISMWDSIGFNTLSNLSKFWKQDFTTHKSNGLEYEMIDLLSTIEPTFIPKIVKFTKQGVFKPVWTQNPNILLSNCSCGSIKEYFRNSGFEWVAIMSGCVAIPSSVIWADQIAVVYDVQPSESAQKDILAIARDSDRLLVDSRQMIHRIGLGPICNPPFKLMNKYIVKLVESIVYQRNDLQITPERKDFVITAIVNPTENDSLVKQMQENGILSLRTRCHVKYIQTTSGPILYDTVLKNPDKYFNELDLAWYNSFVLSKLEYLCKK